MWLDEDGHLSFNSELEQQSILADKDHVRYYSYDEDTIRVEFSSFHIIEKFFKSEVECWGQNIKNIFAGKNYLDIKKALLRSVGGYIVGESFPYLVLSSRYHYLACQKRGDTYFAMYMDTKSKENSIWALKILDHYGSRERVLREAMTMKLLDRMGLNTVECKVVRVRDYSLRLMFKENPKAMSLECFRELQLDEDNINYDDKACEKMFVFMQMMGESNCFFNGCIFWVKGHNNDYAPVLMHLEKAFSIQAHWNLSSLHEALDLNTCSDSNIFYNIKNNLAEYVRDFLSSLERSVEYPIYLHYFVEDIAQNNDIDQNVGPSDVAGTLSLGFQMCIDVLGFGQDKPTNRIEDKKDLVVFDGSDLCIADLEQEGTSKGHVTMLMRGDILTIEFVSEEDRNFFVDNIYGSLKEQSERLKISILFVEKDSKNERRVVLEKFTEEKGSGWSQDEEGRIQLMFSSHYEKCMWNHFLELDQVVCESDNWLNLYKVTLGSYKKFMHLKKCGCKQTAGACVAVGQWKVPNWYKVDSLESLRLYEDQQRLRIRQQWRELNVAFQKELNRYVSTTFEESYVVLSSQ